MDRSVNYATVSPDSPIPDSNPAQFGDGVRRHGPQQVVLKQQCGCKWNWMSWIALLLISLFILLFVVFLVTFVPPGIDSFLSRRIDDRLRLLQQRRPPADCRPCAGTSADDVNCCGMNYDYYDGPSSVEKVLSSVIIIIITTTIFIVLSSLPQGHCESSLGSFDECRAAPSGRRPSDQLSHLTLSFEALMVFLVCRALR